MAFCNYNYLHTYPPPSPDPFHTHTVLQTDNQMLICIANRVPTGRTRHGSWSGMYFHCPLGMVLSTENVMSIANKLESRAIAGCHGNKVERWITSLTWFNNMRKHNRLFDMIKSETNNQIRLINRKSQCTQACPHVKNYHCYLSQSTAAQSLKLSLTTNWLRNRHLIIIKVDNVLVSVP